MVELTGYERDRLRDVMTLMMHERLMPGHVLWMYVAFAVKVVSRDHPASVPSKVEEPETAEVLYYVAAYATRAGLREMAEVRDRLAEMAGISAVDQLAWLSELPPTGRNQGRTTW